MEMTAETISMDIDVHEGGTTVQAVTPSSSVQRDVSDSDMLSLASPSTTAVWSSDDRVALHTLNVRESVDQLRAGSTVLVLGAMGAGKSTLVNALIGESMFPMTTGGGGLQTDTLCVIEFFNDVHLQPESYDVRVVLKDPLQWAQDLRARLSAFDAETVFADEGAATLGVLDNTDMLRALHPLCFDRDAGEQQRELVLRYLNGLSTDDEPALPSLASTDAISAALSMPVRRLKFQSANSVRLLLDRVCRSHVTANESDMAALRAQMQQDEFAPLADLLQFPDPWPLVRLVSVSANVQARGVLPPFLRLLDSPGLGSDAAFTGQDVLNAIKSCVHDRTVTQAWYVNTIEKSGNNVLQLSALNKLIEYVGFEAIRYVYTRCDKVEPSKLNNQRSLISRNIKQTTTQSVPSLTLASVQTSILFTSAYGHAAFDPSLSAAFGMTDAQSAQLRSQYAGNRTQAGVESTVSALVAPLWAAVSDHFSAVQETIDQLVRGCMEKVQGQTAHQQAPLTTLVALYEQYPAVRVEEVQAIGKTDQFSRDINSKLAAAESEAYRIRLSSQASTRLQHLRSSTLMAVLSRNGRFSSSTGGEIDIGDALWQRLHDANDQDAPLRAFSTLYDTLFRSFEISSREAVTAFVVAAEEVVDRDSRLAKSRALRGVAQQLQLTRQSFLTNQGVGAELLRSAAWRTMWRAAVVAKDRAPTGRKSAAATDIIQQTLRQKNIVSDAVRAWCTQLQEAMRDLLHNALRQLYYSIVLAQAETELLDDPRGVLDLLLRHAHAFIAPQRIDEARALLERTTDATRMRRLPLRPAESTTQRTWITGTVDGTPVCLLFRGLCGLDESIARFPMPPLLFPHATVLQGIVPEWTGLLSAPSAAAEPSVQQVELAAALARSSGAALVEATLRSVQGGETDAVPSRPAAEHPDTVESVLHTCKAGMMSLLNPRRLDAAMSLVRAQMYATDETESSPVWGRTWADYRKGFAWLTPPLDRQRLYTNSNTNFLAGWACYTRQWDGAPEGATEVPLPFGSITTGRDMESWFHWRWCSPVVFHLLHLPLREHLHANPFISNSQEPEHALRYTAGLKDYRAGQFEGTLLPITYDAALRCSNKCILGVFVVFAVSESYMVCNSHPKHVRTILQLLEQRRIALKGGARRYGAEAEVTLYGGMPYEDTKVALRLPLIAPDLDAPNAVLEQLYGIQRMNDVRLVPLRAAANKIASTQSAGEPSQMLAQREMRRALAVALGHKVQQWLTSTGFEHKISASVMARA